MSSNSTLNIVENPRGTVLMFAIMKLLSGEPLKAQTPTTEKFYTFLNEFLENLEVNEKETILKINDDLSSFTRKTEFSEEDKTIVLNILKWMHNFKHNFTLVKDDYVRLNLDKSKKGTLKVSVNKDLSDLSDLSKDIHSIPNLIIEDVSKIGYNNAQKQEMIGSTINAVHGKKLVFSIIIPNTNIKNILYMLSNLGSTCYSEKDKTIDIKINGKLKVDICLIGVFTEFCPLSYDTLESHKKVIDEYLSTI
jgi:hypothetical protein